MVRIDSQSAKLILRSMEKKLTFLFWRKSMWFYLLRIPFQETNKKLVQPVFFEEPF